MFELVLFLCLLAIIVPILLLSSVLYNINRTMTGKNALSTEDAIKLGVKNAIKKARKLSKKFFGDQSKISNLEKKSTHKVEDAEYREAK